MNLHHLISPEIPPENALIQPPSWCHLAEQGTAVLTEGACFDPLNRGQHIFRTPHAADAIPIPYPLPTARHHQVPHLSVNDGTNSTPCLMSSCCASCCSSFRCSRFSASRTS